ncbi:MAG: hypothetical protein COB07_10765 [Sulfurovum sp.]|nr:MAG: hypothetical protein COB07_10765 [Sulfurovum sp.]
MANVFDVSKYILEQINEMTVMKLQKLVYYSQAWSLVWNENQLFNSEIQAWANGPVTVELYNIHKGHFKISAETLSKGDSNILEAEEKAIIDKVLDYYGDKTAQWLSDLTHMEQPWILAQNRGCVPANGFCQEPILISDMHEYYSGL